MSTAPPIAVHDPAWHGRLNWMVVFLLLLLPAGYLTEFNPASLLGETSLKATVRFLSTFFPPERTGDFLGEVVRAAWKTVAIATVGTALAVVVAFPLALIANRTLSISRLATGRVALFPAIVRTAIRWVLIFLRSIPEIVWALLFVRAVGLGDTAGVMAIALTYSGMLGKIYIEIFESAEAQGTAALLANGSGRLSSFCYATWPTCLPELTSYTIYRWECAIRASVVMGFVGAGGLGQMMDQSMKMLAGGEVLTMLLVFVLLVWIADLISARLRRVIE